MFHLTIVSYFISHFVVIPTKGSYHTVQWDDEITDDDYIVTGDKEDVLEKKPKPKDDIFDEEAFFSTVKPLEYKAVSTPCDNASTLYILQQNNPKLGKGNNYYHKTSNEGSK